MKRLDRCRATPGSLPPTGALCTWERESLDRRRSLRGHLPGKGIPGGRARAGSHPRLRVVSQTRQGGRHAPRKSRRPPKDHRIRLFAERTLAPRIRSRRLQCRRARPGGVRWVDDRVGRGRRRQLQPSLCDARSRPATRCSRCCVRSTCRRSRTTGCSPRLAPPGSRRRSSTRSRRPSTGHAPARSPRATMGRTGRS